MNKIVQYLRLFRTQTIKVGVQVDFQQLLSLHTNQEGGRAFQFLEVIHGQFTQFDIVRFTNVRRLFAWLKQLFASWMPWLGTGIGEQAQRVAGCANDTEFLLLEKHKKVCMSTFKSRSFFEEIFTLKNGRYFTSSSSTRVYRL